MSETITLFFLKNKSATFENFKELHTLIENQLGTKLNVVRKVISSIIGSELWYLKFVIIFIFLLIKIVLIVLYE